MIRTVGTLLLVVALAGCSTLTTKLATGTQPNISMSTVYKMESAYALARTPLVVYRSLPWCDSHPQPCQDTSVSVKIKKADKTALGALRRLRTFVATHATLNIGSAYSAAQDAIEAAKKISADYNL